MMLSRLSMDRAERFHPLAGLLSRQMQRLKTTATEHIRLGQVALMNLRFCSLLTRPTAAI